MQSPDDLARKIARILSEDVSSSVATRLQTSRLEALATHSRSTPVLALAVSWRSKLLPFVLASLVTAGLVLYQDFRMEAEIATDIAILTSDLPLGFWLQQPFDRP